MPKTKFAFVPRRLNNAGDWFWWKSYTEEEVEARWIPLNGVVQFDAAAFKFKRVVEDGRVGFVTIYRY